MNSFNRKNWLFKIFSDVFEDAPRIVFQTPPNPTASFWSRTGMRVPRSLPYSLGTGVLLKV